MSVMFAIIYPKVNILFHSCLGSLFSHQQTVKFSFKLNFSARTGVIITDKPPSVTVTEYDISGRIKGGRPSETDRAPLRDSQSSLEKINSNGTRSESHSTEREAFRSNKYERRRSSRSRSRSPANRGGGRAGTTYRDRARHRSRSRSTERYDHYRERGSVSRHGGQKDSYRDRNGRRDDYYRGI